MGYVYCEEIMKRTEIQYLRGFLFYGTEISIVDDNDYETRLRLATEEYEKILNETIPNSDQDSPAITKLNALLNVYTDVYLEIGLKAGVRLYKNLSS